MRLEDQPETSKLPRICSVIEKNFEEKNRRPAFVLALSHAFGIVPYRQLGTILKPLNCNLKEFSSAILNDGYMLRNCKAFVLAHVAKRKPRIEDYEISAATASVLIQASRHPTLKPKLEDLADNHNVLDLKQIDKLIRLVLTAPDYGVWLDKFIYAKHRFLAAHAGISAADVKSELLIAANRGLLRMYPAFNDMTHVRNAAKQIAHNRGINILTEHTAKCRSKFDQVGDNRNAYKVFSIEEMQDRNESLEGQIDESYYSTITVSTETPISLSDLCNSFNRISSRIAHMPKKHLFLDLMRGIPNDGFTAYLGTPNDEYAEHVDSKVLLNKACEYVGVNKDKGEEFLKSLRDLL